MLSLLHSLADTKPPGLHLFSTLTDLLSAVNCSYCVPPCSPSPGRQPRCVGVNMTIIRPELSLISFQRNRLAAGTPFLLNINVQPLGPTFTQGKYLGKLQWTLCYKQTNMHTHTHTFVLLHLWEPLTGHSLNYIRLCGENETTITLLMWSRMFFHNDKSSSAEPWSSGTLENEMWKWPQPKSKHLLHCILRINMLLSNFIKWLKVTQL